jgi:hypothetical protein
MTRIFITSILVACLPTLACVTSEQLRRQQYDADYQRALQLCGRPDAAFQAGYNSGYAGESMRGDWTGMCAPATQAETMAAYQTGFVKGANNAPIRVVHSVTGIPSSRHAATAVAQCTFDSDCGGGYHCRSGECMGYGAIGDRCVFNEDCMADHCFGGTCRE